MIYCCFYSFGGEYGPYHKIPVFHMMSPFFPPIGSSRWRNAAFSRGRADPDAAAALPIPPAMLQDAAHRSRAAALPSRREAGEVARHLLEVCREPAGRCRVKNTTPATQQQLSGLQSYNSHSDEDDPERIRAIIRRAVTDADWILDKVRSEMPFQGIRVGLFRFKPVFDFQYAKKK